MDKHMHLYTDILLKALRHNYFAFLMEFIKKKNFDSGSEGQKYPKHTLNQTTYYAQPLSYQLKCWSGWLDLQALPKFECILLCT